MKKFINLILTGALLISFEAHAISYHFVVPIGGQSEIFISVAEREAVWEQYRIDNGLPEPVGGGGRHC
jgi:hypothetical protein